MTETQFALNLRKYNLRNSLKIIFIELKSCVLCASQSLKS